MNIRWWNLLSKMVVIAGGLALILCESTADAFCVNTCDGTVLLWPSKRPPTFQLGKQSFSNADYRGAILAARDAWNQTPADFFYQMSYPTNSVEVDNGINEIWFSTDQNLLAGAPGRTFWQSDCNQITEADVVFDANFSYTPGTVKASSSAYGGPDRTFRTAAAHELGHALGLCHNRFSYNIMGDDSTVINANSSTLRPYAGASGIAGQVYLYGIWPPSAYEDVSVVHWKYGGNDGQYSTHVRTKVYDTSNNPLGTVGCGANNAEPCFKVSKGQTVKVEFTYENLGRHTQNVDIGYYLSTNDLITTNDKLLGTGNIPALGRSIDTTNNTFLTIPNNLTSGQNYFIGAIVNYNKKFSEFTASNNATYIGILVN